MRFANKMMISICLSLLCLLCTVMVYAAPAETSHWNSNTFGNLNTLADKTTVTFSISYNENGTIEWYKDGVLAETFPSTTSAHYTASWPTTGMKEVKAAMTNAGGTVETVWPVEVQDTGDAAIEEATEYPQPRINGYSTLNVTNGWVNMPTLYLKTKKPVEWIEYISSGTYVVKANIDIRQNGILKADDGSARVLKIRALPLYNNLVGTIRASNGGTVSIDSVTLMGWDVDQSVEVSSVVLSAVIRSQRESTLRIRNSQLRHIYIHYENDTTPGDVLDNNYFYEGNPVILNLSDSQHQEITNNVFYHGRSGNVISYNDLYSYNTVENNKFIGSAETPFGDNVVIGKGSRIIGNEFSFAGWNLAEIHTDMFCRDNDFHDNGGIHNGFNGLEKNVYSVNDYGHDFNTDYFSAFYAQLKDDLRTYPTPRDWYPDHIYIFNGRTKKVRCGFNFFGGFNCYVYNGTCDRSSANVQFGADNVFFRRMSFLGTLKPDDSALRVIDVYPGQYGYIRNVAVIDSVFTDSNTIDMAFYPAGGATFSSINSYRKDSLGRVSLPVNYFQWNGKENDEGNPELRFYAWLDVLVKDRNGRLIEDANVTVECVTDPAVSALEATLPPPPPDLWELPSEYLPQPVLDTFVRLKTLPNGKLPGPNYGWSSKPEPCVALLLQKTGVDRSSGRVQKKTTADYQYRIKAAYHGLEASQTVTPDTTWLRKVSSEPVATIELVLNGDAMAGTDTTPPALSITAPENNKPVYGTTAIEAISSDNWDIDRLEIFVDDVSRTVIAADSCTWTADSYIVSWNWNASQETDGLHRIKVVAYDTSGNTTSKTIGVEVLAKAMTMSEKAIVYPNPYIKGRSPGKVCMFANLPADATVRIYTINGEPVTTLAAEMSGGKGSAVWDVSRVSGGVYLYVIQGPRGTQKGKIGIVK